MGGVVALSVGHLYVRFIGSSPASAPLRSGLGKLVTPVCLCHQAVQLGTAQRVVALRLWGVQTKVLWSRSREQKSVFLWPVRAPNFDCFHLERSFSVCWYTSSEYLRQVHIWRSSVQGQCHRIKNGSYTSVKYTHSRRVCLKLMADGPSFLYQKLVRESWYKKFVWVS